MAKEIQRVKLIIGFLSSNATNAVIILIGAIIFLLFTQKMSNIDSF